MLNEEGLVGLDAEKARGNIKDFKNASWEVALHSGWAGTFLFEELSNVWSSENAVNFYNTYEPKFTTFINNVNKTSDILCQNAIRAYNIMAQANGSETIEENYYDSDYDYQHPWVFPKLESNKNGVKGMNITMVRNFILPEFSKKLNEIQGYINKIPSQIALYDTENAQQGSFTTNVNSIISEFSSLSSELVQEINNYIEKEIDTLELAKQQATNTLNA